MRVLSVSGWVVAAAALFLLTLEPVHADDKPEGESAAVLARQALQHHEAGRYAEAARAWEKVLRATPDDREAKLSLAKSLQRLGSPKSLRRSADLLASLGKLDWKDATGGVRRIEVDETQGEVLTSLSEHAEGEERKRLLTRAIDAWGRVLSASASHPGALLGLARAHLAVQQDDQGFDFAERYMELCRASRLRWEMARDQFAARAGPASTPAQLQVFAARIEGARKQELDVLILLARVHMRRKEPAQALARYDAILALGHETFVTHLGRARANLALDRTAAAVEDLQRCLKLADEATPPDVRKRAAKLLEQHSER